MLKVNGNAHTFDYDNAIWGTTTPLNPAAADMDATEHRSQAWSELSFTTMRVGLRETDLRTLLVAVSSSSMATLLGGGLVTLGGSRTDWLGLMASGALQPNCNRIAINNYDSYVRVRIGIVGNNESFCSSVDSYIGIGGGGSTACQGSSGASVASGTRACWGPTDLSGNFVPERIVPAWGYVWVR